MEQRWIPNHYGAHISVQVHRNLNFAGVQPALLLVPGLGASGESFLRWDHPLNARVVAAQGWIVMTIDLTGRGRSGGQEDYGGPVHHSDVLAALTSLEKEPNVDPVQVGVISFSLGCAAVAGALSRDGHPNLTFWMDWEGPSDREIITAGGKLMAPAQGHVLEDDAYWIPREAVHQVANLSVPYLRFQSKVDHAQPGETRHAQRMIQAVASGAAPWFQLNDHPRSTVPNPPSWLQEGPASANRWFMETLRALHSPPQ